MKDERYTNVDNWALGALRVIGKLEREVNILRFLQDEMMEDIEQQYPDERQEEYPREGTVLNPIEQELIDEIAKLEGFILKNDDLRQGYTGMACRHAIKIIEEQRQDFAELLAVIAPLRDVEFDQLNKLAKKCLDIDGMEENPDKIKGSTLHKVGEVIDRANEFFNGR